MTAVTTALVAAGYLLDDSGQQVTGTTPDSGALGRCAQNGAVDVTSTACIQFHDQTYDSGRLHGTRYNSGNGLYEIFRLDQTAYITGHWIPNDGYVGDDPSAHEEPLTDEQIATVVQPALSTSQLQDLLTDPATNTPDEALTEVQTQADALTTEEALLADSDPTNDPVPTPSSTYQEEQLKNQGGQVVTIEDPCDDNPGRVGCMQTGDQLPNDPEIEETAIDFEVTPYSLNTSAQCPAPVTSTLTNGFQLSFDYQPICDFATMINPIITAIGLLIAFMIVSDTVRSGV